MMLPGGEALLRALLARRPDPLLRLSGAGVAGPQPARAVAPVADDPRMPAQGASHGQAQGGVGARGPKEQRDTAPAGGAQHVAEAARVGTAPAAASAPPLSAQLSAAARAIGALLDAQGSQEPAPARGAAPLWSAPAPPATAELARALAHAVEGSGLFYEAHLRELAQGMRSVTQLQEEPQGRLPSAAAQQPPTRADAPPRPPVPHALVPPPLAGGVADPVPAPVLHPGAAEVVQQQLQLLACGVFRWSGEPWPGARMNWELGEDATQAAPERAGRAWTTRLQVVLPSLGEIDATLRLDAGGALQVRVGAADSRAARGLLAERAALLQRFSAAGLTVQACLVEGA